MKMQPNQIHHLVEYRWTEEQVNAELKSKMEDAFESMWESCQKHDLPMRTGAFVLSLQRVVRATVHRGFS
jgi:glutamate dehydrogenase/leucine dehydrogenase